MEQAELITYDALPTDVWVRLTRAANEPANPLRLMAVASVADDGRPANRMLVLRGADSSAGLVWFHTDRRSPKVHHFKTNPYVSAIAYDPREQIQMRLDGHVTLHQNDSLADRHWEQASLAVRAAYSMHHGPGEPLPVADPRAAVMRHEEKIGHVEHGRSNFLVMQVHVETIDWLQIGLHGQRRAVLRAERGWKSEPITP